MATVGPAPALLLERLFSHAPVGLCFVDAELRYVHVNEALAAMNGVPVAEHIGRRVDEVLPDAGEMLARVLQDCMTTGEPVRDLEVTLEREDGEHAYLATYQPMFEDGRPLGVMAIVQNVTAQRRALTASESRFRTLFDANIVAVFVAGDEHILEANDRFLTLVGATREDLAEGRLDWRRMTPAEHADADMRAMHLLRTEGVAEPWEKEYFTASGDRVPLLIGCARLNKDPFRVLCFAVDLTERRRSLERVTRLHQLASALSAALSADEVAAAILQHGMEATGATCGVLGLREEDELVLGQRHRFGEAENAPPRLPLDAPAPMPEAMRTGAPVLLDSRAEWLARFPIPPRGDFEAFAAVPLVGESGPMGCMGLGFPEPRRFDAADVELLQVVARQGAQALERAALYEQRSHVARTLQRGLLPMQLPWVPGLEIASAYEPMGAGDEVGGDFYDVFASGEERWSAVIGDVCGKGVEAAVVTGMVRHTVRGLELAARDPAEVLRRLNDALRIGAPRDRFCSVALVHLERDPEGFVARIAMAGHVPPLVVRGDGTVEEVAVLGGLLGIEDEVEIGDGEILLRPSDALVLYTDGLVEARVAGELFGYERLAQAAAACAGAPASDLTEAVRTAVRDFAPGAAADDRALLVLRVAET